MSNFSVWTYLSQWPKKIKRKYFDEDEEERRSHTHHSVSYHRYFQGYSENKVLTDSSAVGYKIQREYTAHFLALTNNKAKWIKYKLLYTALFLAFAAFDLLALFSGSRANDASWTSLFGVLQILMAVILLIPLGNYVTAPMYMKLGEYNISARRLKNYSRIAAVLAGLYLLLSLIWYLVMWTLPNGNDLLCLLCQLLSAGAILALHLVENRVEYLKIPNKSGSPDVRYQGEIW